MDGSFYPRENQDSFDEHEPIPGPSPRKLLLVTAAAALVVVATLLLLNWAGAEMVTPDEFPTMQPDPMMQPG